MAEALLLRFHRPSSDERDRATAALLDFNAAAVHEISEEEWRVFLRDPADRDRAAEALRPWCEVSAIEIADEDWARRSQQDLKAITVGRLVIAPPWDLPQTRGQASDAARVLVIEPSMGFGTAHHATTRLCLRALQRLDLRGKRVLDVGTGSGVLAIAAAVLGAAQVVAIDHDEDALAAARENVHRNDVDVELRLVDLAEAQLAPADVVVANLTGALLQRSARALSALARGGILIISGLLDEEADQVRSAFASDAASVEEEHEDFWSAMTLTLGEPGE